MNQTETTEKDASEQVFGPEHSGRVRCVGRGPTPSKYFSNLECTSSNEITGIITDMRSRLTGFEKKLDIITDMEFRMSGFEEKFNTITDMESRMDGFGQKLDILADALYALVKQGM